MADLKVPFLAVCAVLSVCSAALNVEENALLDTIDRLSSLEDKGNLMILTA